MELSAQNLLEKINIPEESLTEEEKNKLNFNSFIKRKKSMEK
jgi:hypothetical protein